MGKCNRVADYTKQSQTDRGSLCNEKLVVAITLSRARARADPRLYVCASMRLYAKEHVFARLLMMRFSAKRLAATLPLYARYMQEVAGCSHLVKWFSVKTRT